MGNFENAILTGTGKRYYPNGIVEEGVFKNYILHGMAKRVLPDGTV